MKLNNKGFTLVEIIAAVAILAVLMGVAVAGVSKYQEQAREESYAAMEKSAFSAAQNYIQKKSSVIPATSGITEKTPKATFNSFIANTSNYKLIEISTLVDEGYLPALQDPAAKNANCSGYVYVTKVKGTGATLDKYIYIVEISCARHNSTHLDQNGVETRGVIFNS